MSKNNLKKNKIIRFAVIFVLALFFFCGKLEINIIKYSGSDPTPTKYRIQLFQSSRAQESALPTGGSPLMDTYLEQTKNSPGIWERMISGGIILVLGGIQLVCAWLVNIAAYLLNSMLSPSLYNFTSEPIITTGWAAVRDVCNLFFLLILLFIAFCTILQIEKYHAKKTLLTFILMALLVNFSKPIAIFIFDGSQLLMNFFLAKISSASGGDYASKIADISEITKIFGKYNYGFTKAEVNSYQLVAKYIFAIIFLFMFGIALLVMALYLLIRIIALWLLIIVSPFAFLFNAVPDFKKISSDWWDALFKYSYVGPSIAFFLWLSTFLATSSMKSSIEKSSPGSSQGDPLFTTVIAAILPYLVVLVFLYAAIIISQKFGIAFAGAITSRANKALSFFPRKGWQGTKYAARGAAKWGERKFLMPGGKEGGWNLSPRSWVQGWKERAAEVDRRALSQATADSRDKLGGFFKDGKNPNYHRELAYAQLEGEKRKELESISTESNRMIDEIKKIEAKKAQGKTLTKEEQASVTAALKIIFDNNDQDDFMLDGRGKKDFDPFELREELRKTLTGIGLSEEESARHAYHMQNTALMRGNLGHFGMASFKNGKYSFNNDEQQLAKILGKYGTMESQQKAKILHRNALMREGRVLAGETNPITGEIASDYQRIFTEMHKVGRALAAATNKAELEQLNRARGDTLAAVGKSKHLIDEQVDIIESPQVAAKIKEFTKRMEDLQFKGNKK
ncbi:MAG: hypothetical protein A2359_02695 [Candidatus Moranbacteria bacterium RIFOXYB1_FULL_43_19]|nr:MAG: hypothetical protein A2359_02695 [Candidatus Moranbacteria bacterium RIFOXYB1_FULL_43_19]OGI28990.1 MAG: hypothetical protein A2184_03650 [Candidatus Moranbacteria bacterium RIFOXYA1_FULL_44_7]OGI33943.1 MAG: hypothetical protein A2420_03545 [Candidatus Moranbacteria bacterium RIFOXYC1_FULL_44_13]OGI37290.1 MAG: hypothetical protein A2612_04850 [Candidatus Moranbacteria bacterium RIFOXYD1_FULL_44_12]